MILLTMLLPQYLENGIEIGGEKEKNVRTRSSDRRRSTYHLGSNATRLSSSLCGVSESIGGKLPE